MGHVLHGQLMRSSDIRAVGRLAGEAVNLLTAVIRDSHLGIADRAVPEDGLTPSGLHHFDLLNHPDVYESLRTWLASTGEPSRGFSATSSH